jgi:hypothetical protein
VDDDGGRRSFAGVDDEEVAPGDRDRAAALAAIPPWTDPDTFVVPDSLGG